MNKNFRILLITVLLCSMFTSITSISEPLSDSRESDNQCKPLLGSNSQASIQADPITLYTAEMSDGTIDYDGDSYIDIYYVNITLQIHIPGIYYLIALANVTSISEYSPFPYVLGQDLTAYQGDGMKFLGDVINEDITLQLGFQGQEFNISGISGHIGIFNMSLFDMTNFDPENPPPTGLPPIVYSIGNTVPTEPMIFVSSRAYDASEFEPVFRIFAESWSDEYLDADGDGYYDYFHLIANVNSSYEGWIKANVEIDGYQRAENLTYAYKGILNPIDFWWSAYELNSDGPFNVTSLYFQAWDESTESWQYIMEEEPPDYISSVPPLPRQTSTPYVTISQDNDTWTFDVLDVDTNGKMDTVSITFPVNVSAYAQYRFEGYLVSKYGHELRSENITWLNNGTNTLVELLFDIRELRTMNDFAGEYYFLGNASFHPELNLTLWNYFYVEVRHDDYYFSEYAEGEITHNNALFKEDIDPLPSMAIPITTSEVLEANTKLRYWINFTQPLDSDNLLNLTISLNHPSGIPAYIIDPYGYYLGEIGFDFEVFNFSDVFQYSKLWHSEDTSKLKKTWFLPMEMFGADIWGILHLFYRDGYNFPDLKYDVGLDISITPVLDNIGPTIAVDYPTSAALSDEFRFLFNATIVDDMSGIRSVSVYHSQLSPDVPIASTDPWYFYSLPTWDGPHNITELGIDEQGNIISYFRPDSRWIGTHDFTVKASDMANNLETLTILLTVNDDSALKVDDLINKGLEWLMSQQQTDGSFLFRGYSDQGRRSVAFTSWAMLAMLQNGSSYNDPFVQDCWNWIKGQTRSDGSIVSYELGNANYETSIALMALIPLMISYQVWGIANTELNDAIYAAVNWIVQAQNLEHLGYQSDNLNYGGWNYDPQNISESGYQGWSDLSNSQWSIIALAAARDFGIQTIPQNTWDTAEIFVRRCYSNATEVYNETSGENDYYYGFAYQPEEGGYAWVNSRMNAAGIWCLTLMGYDDSDPQIKEALKYMAYSWESEYVDDSLYSNDYQYYALISAAKALLMTGHSVNTEYSWMYFSIYDFLKGHVLRDISDPNLWYWDNTPGSEDPVYATLLAILSQQIAFGELGEAKLISITVEGRTHLHLYQDEMQYHTGYNYTTGRIDYTENTTYGGPSSFPQQITVDKPYKGYYHFFIYLIDDGEFTIRVAAMTSTGVSITEDSLTYSGLKGDVYYMSILVTTIYGINIAVITPPELYEGEFVIIGNPTVVGPADLTYSALDDETHILEWIVLEMIPPIDYNITKNGVNVKNESDWDGTGIVPLDVSNLEQGTYSYVFTARDAVGDEVIDPVIVTVLEAQITYSLSITSPTADATISGTYVIEWDASSTPEVSMTYQIEYSSDEGANWNDLVTGLTAKQYSWTTTAHDDGDYVIRVTIEETTTSDEVSFTIRNEGAPAVTPFPTFEPILALFALALFLPIIRKRKS